MDTSSAALDELGQRGSNQISAVIALAFSSFKDLKRNRLLALRTLYVLSLAHW